MGTFDYTYAERQRDVNSELYIPFYIESPVDDLDVEIADEDLEVIAVTCAVVDPGGDKIAKEQAVRMVLYTDGNYDTVIGSALTGITIAASTGTLMADPRDTAGIDLTFLCASTGDLVITFTDASGGSESAFLGFFLSNGKFVQGGEVAFTA